MLLSLVYFAVRCPLQTLAPSDRADLAREVEVLVLRHQLKVLSRRPHPPLRRADGLPLAAASRLLPKERWKAFVVSPRALLRCIENWSVTSGPSGIGARVDRLCRRR